MLSHMVAGLLGSGSQHRQPLIESEYYAAPLRYRESSTSTGCGKISAGGSIYIKGIHLALTHCDKVAGLPGTSSQHQHPLTESKHHADPLSDRESSSLTIYGKISAGGPA